MCFHKDNLELRCGGSLCVIPPCNIGFEEEQEKKKKITKPHSLCPRINLHTLLLGMKSSHIDWRGKTHSYAEHQNNTLTL